MDYERELIWEAYRVWGGTFVFDVGDDESGDVVGNFEEARNGFMHNFNIGRESLIGIGMANKDSGEIKVMKSEEGYEKIIDNVFAAAPDISIRLIDSNLGGRLVDISFVDVGGQLYMMYMFSSSRDGSNKFTMYEVPAPNHDRLDKVEQFWSDVYRNKADSSDDVPPNRLSPEDDPNQGPY